MRKLVLEMAEMDGNGQERSRKDIPVRYKWNLAELYADKNAWNEEKKELKAELQLFSEYQGRLADSADTLYECLEQKSDAEKKFLKLASYASRLYDEDTRKSEPQAMQQNMNQIGTDLSSALSFIEPEILTVPDETIEKFLNEHSELKKYEQYLDNLQRQKAHTLSPSEEKIVSQAGLMAQSAYDIYGIFKNADMPRPTLAIDGEDVRLDDASFSLHRTNKDRGTRQKVFEEFFGKYQEFERTFGTKLASQINKDIFYKNVRGYESCLERSLDDNNIPTSVYHNLIQSVHDNLPTLHRYLDLRKRVLKVDELHYYDLYPPLVPDVDLKYEVDEAEDLIVNALSPLGERYTDTLTMAFQNRWIDMMPTTGKRSGAYSTGAAYDVHPYILMNYNKQYNDVSTLAHELGHTMHSYYSNKHQPFVDSHYPIFLAEVASITNEELLMDYMLKKIDDPEQRLAIIGDKLESFRATLFRQTQFAEFELKIHEMAEEGEALTGETLTEVYLTILKKYYGHEQGVMVIDDFIGIEWAYIPHFYYNFYVFQYATSMCAATTVGQKILEEGEEMRNKYIDEFLSAGSSDYAIPILKRIGVDMTSSEPYEIAFRRMEETIDQIEQLL